MLSTPTAANSQVKKEKKRRKGEVKEKFEAKDDESGSEKQVLPEPLFGVIFLTRLKPCQPRSETFFRGD